MNILFFKIYNKNKKRDSLVIFVKRKISGALIFKSFLPPASSKGEDDCVPYLSISPFGGGWREEHAKNRFLIPFCIATLCCLLLCTQVSAQMDVLNNLQEQIENIATKDSTDTAKDDAKEAVAAEENEVTEDETRAETTPGAVRDNLNDAIDKATDIISPSKILTIVIASLFVWLTTKGTNWMYRSLADSFNRRRLQILRLQPITNVVLWLITIYVLVVTLFNPTSDTLWALMGSSAFALGFAAQDILKNIIGGLMIIFDRPFQVGDRINIGGNYGEVVRIGIRNTNINTLDDSIVTIPNSKIISEHISNANSGALDCMVVVDLWLPVGIDVERVRKIAFEAAITSRYLNIDKAVSVLFFDHFDNQPATNVKIKAYVLDARYEKGFAGDVTEAAKKALSESGIYEAAR